jgi:hypothetical protein
MKDHITVEGRDGTFDGYIARPNTLPAAAVVVLHEVFGVNADIRKHCDELAEQGFVSIKPMTETQALRTSRTPPTRSPNCPSAPAKWLSLATA